MNRPYRHMAAAGLAVAAIASASIAARPADAGGTRVALTVEALSFDFEQEPDGKKLYSKECASCHGKQGRGNGRAGRDMDPRPTDITDPEFLDGITDEEMTTTIVEGDGEMEPAEEILSAEEIAAVVAYVRTLGEKRKK